MNARALQDADRGTPLEVPPPLLFNTFKHHAGALRARIRDIAGRGEPALRETADRLAVLGTKLMDLYTGTLWPRDICERVVRRLESEGRLAHGPFRDWLAGCQDYAVVEFAEDQSRWVLRLGDDPERFIHLHPGRWSPATVRVRANVLKTAFLVHIHARIHAAEPMDRDGINHVRRTYLNLSPLGADPDGEQGLGAILDLLRQEG